MRDGKDDHVFVQVGLDLRTLLFWILVLAGASTGGALQAGMGWASKARLPSRPPDSAHMLQEATYFDGAHTSDPLNPDAWAAEGGPATKIITSKIPGAAADQMAERITVVLEQHGAPAWLRKVNYAHLTNLAINVLQACSLSSHASGGTGSEFGDQAMCLAVVAMSVNFMGLAFDNGVLSFGRALQSSDDLLLADGKGELLVKQLTKWRAIVHGVCISILPIPVACLGWENGLMDNASLVPWLLAAVAAAGFSFKGWSGYDTAELTAVHDEAEAAQDRGVHSFTTGRVLELVGPSVAVCLMALTVGGLSMSHGEVLSGGLCVAGSVAMLAAAGLRVPALDNYGETSMFGLVGAALIVGQDMAGSALAYDATAFPPEFVPSALGLL